MYLANINKNSQLYCRKKATSMSSHTSRSQKYETDSDFLLQHNNFISLESIYDENFKLAKIEHHTDDKFKTSQNYKNSISDILFIKKETESNQNWTSYCTNLTSLDRASLDRASLDRAEIYSKINHELSLFKVEFDTLNQLNHVLIKIPSIPKIVKTPLPKRRLKLNYNIAIPKSFSERIRTRFYINNNPIYKEITAKDKSKLSYYYKNKSYKYDAYLNKIKQIFHSAPSKDILAKSINTIQSLLNIDGYIYPRAMNAIKNELYFFCIFNGSPMVSKNDISNFIDEVVQLSRYQPSYFSYPERTLSITRLFKYLNLNLNDKTEFKDIKILNNINSLYEYDENLTFHEIHHRSSNFNANIFIEDNLNIENMIHAPNIFAELGSNYEPLNDYPKTKLTSSEIKQIQSEIQMALINYNDLVNMLKNQYDFLKNIPDEIEIEIENKNISGIKELKILLKDIITLDNIILNEDKNDQFMFIAMKRNETLFLHPYTPESFNGTIEVKGLQEQLTRMPIVLQKIGDVDSINLSEDSWSILPRDLFLKIFRDN